MVEWLVPRIGELEGQDASGASGVDGGDAFSRGSLALLQNSRRENGETGWAGSFSERGTARMVFDFAVLQ